MLAVISEAQQPPVASRTPDPARRAPDRHLRHHQADRGRGARLAHRRRVRLALVRLRGALGGGDRTTHALRETTSIRAVRSDLTRHRRGRVLPRNTRRRVLRGIVADPESQRRTPLTGPGVSLGARIARMPARASLGANRRGAAVVTMTMTVRPIRDDLTFGARVAGVTLEGLRDAGLRARLNDSFEEHGLLIFEDIDPTPRVQVAISEGFGPLKEHPSKAVPRGGTDDDMLGVIEMRHEPNQPGAVQLDGRLLASWLPWHFDHCYNDQLNRAGVLRAIEV